jgi:hypothetical protein
MLEAGDRGFVSLLGNRILLTQPLSEMSTRILPLVKGLSALKVDNLTAIYAPIV